MGITQVLHQGRKLPYPFVRQWSSAIRSFVTEVMRSKKEERQSQDFYKSALYPVLDFLRKLTDEEPVVNISDGKETAESFIWLTVSVEGIKFLDAKIYGDYSEMQLTSWTPIPCSYIQFTKELQKHFPSLPKATANIISVFVSRGEDFGKIMKRILGIQK